MCVVCNCAGANCLCSLKLYHYLLAKGLSENFLPYNPIAQVKAPKIAKHQVKKVQALTPEQQINLLSAAKEYSEKLGDPRWYMMISILIETGVRKGELCALQWKHVDFENRCIYVGQSIDWNYGETKGRIKTNEDRSWGTNSLSRRPILRTVKNVSHLG